MYLMPNKFNELGEKPIYKTGSIILMEILKIPNEGSFTSNPKTEDQVKGLIDDKAMVLVGELTQATADIINDTFKFDPGVKPGKNKFQFNVDDILLHVQNDNGIISYTAIERWR